MQLNHVICSHVKAIDSQLDRLQLSISPESAEGLSQSAAASDALTPGGGLQLLHDHINLLTITSTALPSLVPVRTLLHVLHESFISAPHHQRTVETDPQYRDHLEWILLAKATAQVYGHVLDVIINRTLPLNDEIWYWKNILSSYRYTGLYSIQTSPLRLWNWSRRVLYEVRAQNASISDGWRHFYDRVRSVVRNASIANVHKRVVNPLVLVRAELQQKQANLENARRLHASCIGYLLSNGINAER